MALETKKLGRDAINSKGWLAAHKWLLLRRISQLGILAVFLLGPWFGIWIVKGNLMSSLTLDVLPLTDPYVLMQSLFAGHLMEMTAITGALIVLAFYMLVGGRVYCSWVCPVNLITDAANWLRNKLAIKGGTQLSRNTRYWVLAMSFVAALATGTIAWELINPVSILQRAIIFGSVSAWMVVLAIFVFEAFVSQRGWCGHLCPVGAFYSLLAKFSLLRVNAYARNKCDDCMECFAICPEPQVITPALRGEEKNISSMIMSANCTNCGRCIDICSKDVFKFDHRFNKKISIKVLHQREVLP
ncbi:MAG: quinol dehydrogenase ferredoxin subunit NapH [Gammaproteobacteria bacterium]|nr:quinol dehydrogenase ferredoxin subunit NapH [Gammaproteobacteria bacterium]MCW9003892.1 quinol dehydrogenase ferredoxin subunit NapH [Gammaproteobacteria bacterium]MCW9056241.1 quinol dehydrogenase ferredoxin subunit NapH [Gammaproteobacteria bacterium]